MSDMQAEADRAAQEEQLSLPQVLSEKSMRWQLVSICLMMLCQQLSGTCETKSSSSFKNIFKVLMLSFSTPMRYLKPLDLI